MVSLAKPVTIPASQVRVAADRTITIPAITLTELDVTLVDNAKAKRCMAHIRGARKPLTLWQGAAYDAAGDYTQAQAEARILELLGDDPAKVLSEPPAPPAVKLPSLGTKPE